MSRAPHGILTLAQRPYPQILTIQRQKMKHQVAMLASDRLIASKFGWPLIYSASIIAFRAGRQTILSRKSGKRCVRSRPLRL